MGMHTHTKDSEKGNVRFLPLPFQSRDGHSETWLTSFGVSFPGAEAQVFGKPQNQG